MEYEHFKGKDALGHVAEAQAIGKISASEIHGTEPPGQWVAGADSSRDMAISLLMLYTLLQHLILPLKTQLIFLIVFAFGLTIWRIGRSAWLGWSRLERLHRLLTQEKYEIDHHRAQEKAELKVLYAAKGFEGKLLDDVVDVLMADGDRLLRVMVEEELGLTLENQEHPLEQSLGAALGCIVTAFLAILGAYLFPWVGLLSISFIVIGVASGLLAHFYGNRLIPAVIWSIGLAILSLGMLYFLLEYVLKVI